MKERAMWSNQAPEFEFWRGEFGDEYSLRNAVDIDAIRARITLWTRILTCTVGAPPRDILEVGSNIGLNLRALRALTPVRLRAVEPNSKAREILLASKLLEEEDVLDGLASTIAIPDRSADLVFTSGVLIHIHPDRLLESCREMHRVSGRFIACVEYFSAMPEVIPYRGHSDKLFKRDFGSFWLDNFPDLEVLDYGFAWKRVTGLDNLTWWMFRKRDL